MLVKFTLDTGIIEGDLKRFLEGFNTGIKFTQRKSYDEYYSDTYSKVDTTLEVLSLISERLFVEIDGDEIILKDI